MIRQNRRGIETGSEPSAAGGEQPTAAGGGKRAAVRVAVVKTAKRACGERQAVLGTTTGRRKRGERVAAVEISGAAKRDREISGTATGS